MKVGILQFFGWRDRSVPLGSVYDTALERFSIMDEAGYDAVWLAEHHFSSFSVCPSVHMMGTMVAARTRQLRIGTAVSLARSTTRCVSPRRSRCWMCSPADGSTGVPAGASSAASSRLL